MKTKGRPKGSEKDDSKALNAMADMIHANPALKPTPAMRRHNPKIDVAEIRRLQGKWKERKDTLLAAAQARTEVRRKQADTANLSVQGSGFLGTEAARTARETYNSPLMRAMREIQDNPASRAVREFQNNPTMRAIYEAQNGTAIQAIRAFQEGPLGRALREIAEAKEHIAKLAGGGWQSRRG